MTKENILQEVRKAMQATNNHVSNYFILSALSAALIEDIRHENNKNNNAGKVEKLVKDILKTGAKNGASKMMQYTYIHEDGKQYCLDGHRLLELYTPIEAPDWIRDGDKDLRYYEVKKMMPAAYENYITLSSPDAAELRTFVKANKKENPICKLYTPGDDLYINALWLSLAMDCFTNPIIEIGENHGRLSPIIVSGEEGRLLILPVNMNGLQNRYKYIFDSATNKEMGADEKEGEE